MPNTISDQILAFFKKPVGVIVLVLVAIVAICCGGSAVLGGLIPDAPEPKVSATPTARTKSPEAVVSPTLEPVVVITTTSAAAPAPVPTTKSPTPKPVKTSSAPKPACHPNYSACLPIRDDVDCGEISHRNFQVIGSDPYRLDGDNDGIACES